MAEESFNLAGIDNLTDTLADTEGLLSSFEDRENQLLAELFVASESLSTSSPCPLSLQQNEAVENVKDGWINPDPHTNCPTGSILVSNDPRVESKTKQFLSEMNITPQYSLESFFSHSQEMFPTKHCHDETTIRRGSPSSSQKIFISKKKGKRKNLNITKNRKDQNNPLNLPNSSGNDIQKNKSLKNTDCLGVVPAAPRVLGRYASGELYPGTFSCELCDELFGDQSSLDAHILTQHTASSVVHEERCDFCPLLLKSKTNKKRHMDNCHALRPGCVQVHCEICNVSFTSKFCLQAHLRKFHLYDRNENGEPYIRLPTRRNIAKCFACHLCEVTFKEKNNLRRHVKAVHWKVFDFQCDICGKKVSTKNNLNVHLKKHEKARQ